MMPVQKKAMLVVISVFTVWLGLYLAFCFYFKPVAAQESYSEAIDAAIWQTELEVEEASQKPSKGNSSEPNQKNQPNQQTKLNQTKPNRPLTSTSTRPSKKRSAEVSLDAEISPSSVRVQPPLLETYCLPKGAKISCMLTKEVVYKPGNTVFVEALVTKAPGSVKLKNTKLFGTVTGVVKNRVFLSFTSTDYEAYKVRLKGYAVSTDGQTGLKADEVDAKTGQGFLKSVLDTITTTGRAVLTFSNQPAGQVVDKVVGQKVDQQIQDIDTSLEVTLKKRRRFHVEIQELIIEKVVLL